MESLFQILVVDSTEPTLIIQGIVDFTTVEQVRNAARSLVRRGHSNILIDASAIEFIDSSGISAFVDLAKTAHGNKGQVTLANPSHQLLRLISMVGLLSLFNVRTDASAQNRQAGTGVRNPWLATRFVVPCRMELVAEVRDRIADIAHGHGYTCQDIEDIKVAVGEAMANAFRHGCRGQEDTSVVVRCTADTDRLVIEITDPGKGFDCNALKPPVIEEVREGGMGVHFMKLLMDRIEYFTNAQGCTVRMTKMNPRESLPVRSAGYAAKRTGMEIGYTVHLDPSDLKQTG